MVDMAHIAGPIAAGLHPSPFGWADIITTTTHKTLRGPRGGMIFCRPALAKQVDGAVFPGNQGGPLENVIAAKAVCAKEAMSSEYRAYMDQTLKNTKAMADTFKKLGYDIVSGGTDNHLFLIDLSRTHPNFTGLQVQEELDKYLITLNKNIVPGDKRSPKYTIGIRLGCAAMTTRGWKEQDAIDCAYLIHKHLERMKEND
jgi:glycine hydroxymethyltransferase